MSSKELYSFEGIMGSVTRLASVFIIISLLSKTISGGSSFMFELPDKEKFCVVERFEGPVRYIFEYRVIRGGNNDVDASVKSPNGKVLYSESKMKRDRFDFETSRGEYTFCFGNEFSTFAHKVVYFSLRPYDLDSLAGEAGIKRPIVRTSAESSCEQIHETMTHVVEFQRDYRLRESIGRHIAEGLNRIVSWWCLTQGCFILVAGLGQVLVLKRFFTEKAANACKPVA